MLTVLLIDSDALRSMLLQGQAGIRGVLKTVQWMATSVLLVLFVVLNRNKQGIHDRLSRTKVIKAR